MLAESRKNLRQNIYLEEVNGSFCLQMEDKNYDSILIRDVSVSGAGIQLSESLEVGSAVDLVFSTGDWKITAQGWVVWCIVALARNKFGARALEGYRIGIKFNPRNANNNVIFFMASRSMVNPHI